MGEEKPELIIGAVMKSRQLRRNTQREVGVIHSSVGSISKQAGTGKD